MAFEWELKCLYSEGKANPVEAYYNPRGFQEFEAHRFRDNGHMKVVRVSSLGTGLLYCHELFLALISVRG